MISSICIIIAIFIYILLSSTMVYNGINNIMTYIYLLWQVNACLLILVPCVIKERSYLLLVVVYIHDLYCTIYELSMTSTFFFFCNHFIQFWETICSMVFKKLRDINLPCQNSPHLHLCISSFVFLLLKCKLKSYAFNSHAPLLAFLNLVLSS